MFDWELKLTKDELLDAYYPGGWPNRAAALAAAILFAVATVGVIGTTIKTRSWWMLVCVVTGMLEVVGYSLRARMLEAPEYYKFVVSYAFLVIAPVFLVIVNYLCVAKLIGTSAAGRKSKFAKAVAWFMSVSEGLCLAVQCSASGPLTSKDDKQRDLGRKIMLTGLCMQVGFFTVFTVITRYVHASSVYGYRRNTQYRFLFGVLYSSIISFYIRNIFRVVEFAQGFSGHLATHELFFYVFDFIPMCTIMFQFAVFNYGWWLSTDDKTHCCSNGDARTAVDTEAPAETAQTVAAGKSASSTELVIVRG